jgi:pimeloyl-ACP methyl ester carboxylesterase
MMPHAVRRPVTSLAIVLLAASLAGAGAQELFSADNPLEIADQGVFIIPGQYIKVENRTIMAGQMYVQYQIPRHRTRPYPVVFIPGGGQTAWNFLTTPDGRRGWADDFVAHGYAVYVVDQPGRGRSGFFAEAYGDTRKQSVNEVKSRTTEMRNLWPQAELFTQWPGPGTDGDPAFDAFFASRVEGIRNEELAERLNRAAGAKLLERIGPAILLTHSQSGLFAWAIADQRPDLVQGILSIEPNGPPIRNVEENGPPDYFADGPVVRAWGITAGPMTYDPPITSPAELKLARQEKSDGPDLVRCFVQAEPARKLPRLSGIPILMVMGEASRHAPYDHCTSKWLDQAGVKHSFVRLADHGIHGNGHEMMLEKNNLDISGLLRRWEQENVR